MVDLAFNLLIPLNFSFFKQIFEYLNKIGCYVWMMHRQVFAFLHNFDCYSSCSRMSHKNFGFLFSWFLEFWDILCCDITKNKWPIYYWFRHNWNIFIEIKIIFRNSLSNISWINNWDCRCIRIFWTNISDTSILHKMRSKPIPCLNVRNISHWNPAST